MARNLSIIIPHYSKQEALRRVHDELKLQMHPKDEVIIVDDYSPGGVPELNCKCTKILYPPEKISPHTYRLCTLRNIGLRAASHDACIILDPDCLPSPHFLDNARAMCDPSVLFGGRIDVEDELGVVHQDARLQTGRSRWVDMDEKNVGVMIYGGCMMFSRSRTSLIGWFDTEFNGVWGAEEHEFASRCYHSGMRLRYTENLRVTHLWHPKSNHDGYHENVEMWLRKERAHQKSLNTTTPYNPLVGVMVITMLRPDLIDQCLQAVFRNRMPVKVRLVVNGDDSKETMFHAVGWGRRWAVDLVVHERRWPARIRNESMEWAINNGFKYIVFLDDDMTVSSDGLTNLVREAEAHPEYHAISGSFKSGRGIPDRMLGGRIKDGAFYNYPWRKATVDSDWVGGGFTIHRLNPLIPYDESYQTGYNDLDWSMTARSAGLKLGVTGLATAYHQYRMTRDGPVRYTNPRRYGEIRHDRGRHARMNELFREKWGFPIWQGGLWMPDEEEK